MSIDSDLKSLHREAMRFTDLAFEARLEGNEQLAQTYFQQALTKEQGAANLVATQYTNEPTRSVLHRSAATLALDVGDVRLAEKLAARGLEGDPPFEIAEELREVLDRARFDRHLQLIGVTLAPDEFQFSIDGPAIAPGMAQIDVFLERIRNVERLVVRTAQRLLKQDFSERIKNLIQVYLATPRSASFAVTVKIGVPDQLILPGFQDLFFGPEIINEMLICIDLINRGEEDNLRSRFETADPPYYQNFLALSQKIAPDGEQVNLVGFTHSTDNRELRVPFTRLQESIPLPPQPPLSPSEVGREQVVTGRLRFADEVSESNTIKLIQRGKRRPITIKVPTGYMSDIVAPLWGKQVRASIIKYPKLNSLRNIEEVPDDDAVDTAVAASTDKQPRLL